MKNRYKLYENLQAIRFMDGHVLSCHYRKLDHYERVVQFGEEEYGKIVDESVNSGERLHLVDRMLILEAAPYPSKRDPIMRPRLAKPRAPTQRKRK